MGALSSLLRWKREVKLLDEDGNPILGENGKPVIVWVRIITEKDLEDAFIKARIASAEFRVKLFNPLSEEAKAYIDPFDTAPAEQCYEMALAGLGANWLAEALSNVVRPDKAKIEEVAIDPDAPSLEEQEKLDALNTKIDDDYRKALGEYVDTKQTEAKATLDALTEEDLRQQAKRAVAITLPLEVYLNTLDEAKVWRAVYLDKECTTRGFDSLTDYQETSLIIKTQLKTVYEELEAGHSEIKN